VGTWRAGPSGPRSSPSRHAIMWLLLSRTILFAESD